MYVVPPFVNSRARICNRLWSPGIDTEKSIPPDYVARRAGTKIGLSYWPARLGIDSWAPQVVYKYGLCTFFNQRKSERGAVPPILMGAWFCSCV
jgi:hypothetical protein